MKKVGENNKMAYSKEFYKGLKNNELKRKGFREVYIPEWKSILGGKVESVIDVGCGTGTLLSEFNKAGVLDLKGIDFHENKELMEISEEIYEKIDLNQISESILNEKKYQLAVCLECAEHLESTSADGLIQFLVKASDIIWFSAAIPYQGGDDHINEQWPEYWEKKFNYHGYVRIDWFRRKTWDNWDLMGYYRQNMMIYAKEEKLYQYPSLEQFYKNENYEIPKHVVHPTVYSYAVKNSTINLHIDNNPKTKLEESNIKNARLLIDREMLLEKIPQGGIMAEIGVAKGGFSRKILDICRPKKLYCIDVWFDEDAYKETIDVLKDEIDKGIVEILRGDSTEQLLKIEDGILDFVYIDAMHDYKHPKKELQICKNKVKDKGYIAGHDYTVIDANMNPPERYGVINAVNEFIVENDYELIYFTMEHLFMNPSYCLKKKE